MEFHETGYGRKFYEHDLPELIKSINRLADVQENTNKLIERQLEVSDRILEEQVKLRETMIACEYDDVISMSLDERG